MILRVLGQLDALPKAFRTCLRWHGVRALAASQAKHGCFGQEARTRRDSVASRRAVLGERGAWQRRQFSSSDIDKACVPDLAEKIGESGRPQRFREAEAARSRWWIDLAGN